MSQLIKLFKTARWEYELRQHFFFLTETISEILKKDILKSTIDWLDWQIECSWFTVWYLRVLYDIYWMERYFYFLCILFLWWKKSTGLYTQQLPAKVQTCCRIWDQLFNFSVWDFDLTVVQPDLDSEFREAWISSLILFPPFAVSFLEHGLPVDMQNIIALATGLLNATEFK